MRRRRRRHARAQVAFDILHDDDCVVDDDADGKHQAEQRQIVDRYSKAARIANAPNSETGIAITGMIVARQVCRNTNTTPTTSRIATKIVTMTSLIDFAMKTFGS